MILRFLVNGLDRWTIARACRPRSPSPWRSPCLHVALPVDSALHVPTYIVALFGKYL